MSRPELADCGRPETNAHLNAIGSRPNGPSGIHFSEPGQMGLTGADELEALKRKGVVAGV